MCRSVYLALAAVFLMVGIASATSTRDPTTDTGTTGITAGGMTTGGMTAGGMTTAPEPEPSNESTTMSGDAGGMTSPEPESTTPSGAGFVTISAVLLLLNTALALLLVA